MKLTKLFSSLFLVGALFSCSNDEPINEDAISFGSFDLVSDLSTYQDSSLGMYKGVFTTTDSQDRGTVVIKVINGQTAEATITYLNGIVEFYKGAVQQTEFTAKDEMNIVFNSINSRSSSFVFNVDDDGSNPSTTEVISNSRAALITVVKENTRDAVVPLTGTFVTDQASVADASGTWSIIFNTGTGQGNDTDITTQTIFNTVDLGSLTGSSQSGCVVDGDVTICDIQGMYTSQGIEITWNGTHLYTTAVNCSSTSGTWSTLNGFSGTFISDSQCLLASCEGMLNTFTGAAGGEIFDNNFLNSTATSTAMGTIGVDADIDNVTINITHSFVGDLDISLVSPEGTTLDLSSDNGAGGNNYSMTEFRDGAPNITTSGAPFTGSFQSEGGTFATTFNGESVSGDWLLSIFDDSTGDTGTLNSWSIGFCDENIVNSPESPVDRTAEMKFKKEMEGLTKKEYKRLQQGKPIN
ncbi:proprotein convertase P-domain-containing protein [Dokdonia ponticola]|uniref:Proprotein convertase P-domain-containing protein n=1 Tax=Dokdonia ponticola TaxID=2041041 RepID=A0ABV9HVV4_9FLAO